MILIVPDVHGRDFYVNALTARPWDHIVFLGDYLDPYRHEFITSETAIERFKEILAFKRANAERVTLLLGNHDMHYSSDVVGDLACSSRYDYRNAKEIKRLFVDNYDLFQLAWETTAGERRVLMTHAPVLRSWLDVNRDVVTECSAAALNGLLGDEAGERALSQVGRLRGGFQAVGGPLWADVREAELPGELPEGIYQVFGHTQQPSDPIITDRYACLDCRRCFTLDDAGRIAALDA